MSEPNDETTEEIISNDVLEETQETIIQEQDGVDHDTLNQDEDVTLDNESNNDQDTNLNITDEMNITLDGDNDTSQLDDSIQYDNDDLTPSIDIDQPVENDVDYNMPDEQDDNDDTPQDDEDDVEEEDIRTAQQQYQQYTATEQQEDYVSEEEQLRQRYLKVYKLAREKNHQLQLQKQQVEDRLAHYFKTSKKPQEFKEKTLSSNAEERYKKFVETHREKRIELSRTRKKNAAQIRELLSKLQNKQSAASKLQTSYREYKMGAAEKAENSRTGKPIPHVKIDELAGQEVKKDEEVRAIRTKFIYLTNQKDALEKSIKQKEFSDGLHLIDFEQFKMENATLNEKIEEKNESLQKSRLKARSTVHILTHVNEKLQFVQTEDIEMKQRLADLEKELSANKKLLASLKDTRDHYKTQNTRMRDSNPLIGNDQLLVDYESRKQELEDLRYNLKHLRNLHQENERKTDRAKRQFNSLVSRQETQGRFLPNIHASQRVGGI
mmetsp:Transcript_11105/g.41464  ORF Transcript_11105/g.41464 Transcript_11105/m.41464 type:complete len:494 (-) Transcript_11105:2597-4078(-)|eukprot:CAMPEP_0117441188 /NCGR_PEP_ID=MMETSP0759-20121206/3503_1 /TAXON_ID=63605 /ORGANISM="Percolomonas cosmopolitus, Strain WS" /LENGTH=493 /DNA_ID=CAMNT_0005233029 /DNA_START=417 /DNA_END=1898 /DNA_ORIENTATION=+